VYPALKIALRKIEEVVQATGVKERLIDRVLRSADVCKHLCYCKHALGVLSLFC
jgi:hypothetical protein